MIFNDILINVLSLSNVDLSSKLFYGICLWAIPQEVPMNLTQIAKFMGPTWGPPGSCGPQLGPMLAPWTLQSGNQ